QDPVPPPAVRRHGGRRTEGPRPPARATGTGTGRRPRPGCRTEGDREAGPGRRPGRPPGRRGAGRPVRVRRPELGRLLPVGPAVGRVRGPPRPADRPGGTRRGRGGPGRPRRVVPVVGPCDHPGRTGRRRPVAGTALGPARSVPDRG